MSGYSFPKPGPLVLLPVTLSPTYLHLSLILNLPFLFFFFLRQACPGPVLSSDADRASGVLNFLPGIIMNYGRNVMSFGGLQTSLRAFCSLPSPCDAGKATRWHTRPAQQSPQVFHVTASFQKGNLGITKHYSAMDPLGVVLELLLGAVGKNRNFSPFAESQPSLSAGKLECAGGV